MSKKKPEEEIIVIEPEDLIEPGEPIDLNYPIESIPDLANSLMGISLEMEQIEDDCMENLELSPHLVLILGGIKVLKSGVDQLLVEVGREMEMVGE
ncbi:MAG: hypothetical protein ACXABY_08730 [Candidatus Thorarchaeota archaeon]|jgi:hypothetical protein